MPSVAPSAQPPQVMPGAAPEVPANLQMPLSAAGGGPVRQEQAQVGEQLAEHIGRAVQLEKLKADQVSAAERSAAIQQLSTKYLYGDQNSPGYLASQGQNAIQDIKPMMDNSDKDMQAILASAPNDDVRRLVLRNYEETRDTMNRQANAHLMEQRDVYATNTLNGLLSANSDAAAKSIGTPDWQNVVEKNLSDGLNAIRSYGVVQKGDILIGQDGKAVKDADGHPMAGPETQAMMDSFTQRYQTGVVQSMLGNGDPRLAKQYFEHNADDFKKNPALYDSLNRAVMTDYTRQEATIKADGIIQAATSGQGMTLDQMKSEALQKTEGLPTEWGYKTQARQAVSQWFDDRKQALKQQAEQQSASAYDYIVKNGKLPPAYMTEGMDQASLWKFLNDRPKTSDKQTLYALKDMASSADPKQRVDFEDENLYDYAGKLSDPDFKSMLALQARMRTPGRNGLRPDNGVTPDMAAWRQQTEVGNEAMLALGWDPNMPTNRGQHFWQSASPTQVQQFRENLDDAVQNWQQANNKQAGRKDIEGLAQQLVLRQVQDRQNGVFVFKNAPHASSVEDIPAAGMQMVNTYLKNNGIKNPTDAQRLTFYQQMVQSAQSQ